MIDFYSTMPVLDSLHLKFDTFSYSSRSTCVLSQIDWTLSAGDSWLLCGENGSGKTTFLKILCGLIPLKSGFLTLNGRNKESYSEKDFFSFFGMVFQKNALFDGLSVEGQLQFVLNQTATPYDRIETYLKAVGLWQAKNHLPVELSGGMRKRLAIVRALIVAPPILLCDDPVAGLDPITVSEVMEFIVAEAAAQNITLVIAAQPRLIYRKWFKKGAVLKEGSLYTFDVSKPESEFPHL